MESFCVAYAGLKLKIFLPLPPTPQCSGYRCKPPGPNHVQFYGSHTASLVAVSLALAAPFSTEAFQFQLFCGPSLTCLSGLSSIPVIVTITSTGGVSKLTNLPEAKASFPAFLPAKHLHSDGSYLACHGLPPL